MYRICLDEGGLFGMFIGFIFIAVVVCDGYGGRGRGGTTIVFFKLGWSY